MIEMSKYHEIKASIYIKNESMEAIRKKAVDYYNEEITDEKLDKILSSLVELIVSEDRIKDVAEMLLK